VKQHTPKPLVLCEGKEDLLVIEALANHAGVGNKLSFQQYGGKDRLRAYLHLLKASPEYVRGEYSKILVTRDADTNFDSSWDALKGAVKEAFDCEVSEPGAWIKFDEAPDLAAWIIPGPGKTGMVETLCVESSRTKAPQVFACLDSFAGCISGIQGVPLHEKARFEIWTIAAQGAGAKGRMSLPYAIPNLPIDWDDEAFTSLKSLLVNIAT
jgi:hypothetical protein